MPLSTICLPIRSELALLERELESACVSNIDLVQNAASYVLRNGGKRIRPAVMILSARLLGASSQNIAPLAAAIELVHAASLLHDDVLDNAPLRRGKPSANTKWGNQISILLGDFFWCSASHLAVKHGSAKIWDSMIDAVSKTTRGEILEIVKTNDWTVTKKEYLEIITLKTAHLFQSACRIGAIFAEAGETFERALMDYGINIGIAFQLADDVLDYSSSDEQFGKRVGTDIKEGRFTLPLLLTLAKGNSSEIATIKNILLSAVTDRAALNHIRDILNRHGSIEASLKEANAYAGKAKDALTPFKPSLFKDALTALADYAVSRRE